MSNVWGDGESSLQASPVEQDEDVDEFKIQNELAHTMSSMFQPSTPGMAFDDNPFKDDDEGEEVLGNEEEEDDVVSDQDKSNHEDADDVWKANEAKTKKTHLMSSLTEDSEYNGFLKSPEPKDIDDVLVSPSGGDTAVDGLMQLANTEPIKETIESKRTVTSPNRKIHMIRPRRLQANASKVADPLSTALSLKANESSSSLLESPGTIKRKVISNIEAPLFNIDKNEVLKSAKEMPIKTPNTHNNNMDVADDEAFDDEYHEEVNGDSENNIKFDICVGDPMKVGDFTNTHTIYTVTTKTSFEVFDHEETVVTRRYKDFLWLYNKLMNNHPGFIIPAPPEKQMVNRFDSKFIENRRMGLERMLQRISIRPIFQKDKDWILFLQSSDFVNESAKSEDSSPIGLADDNFNVNTMADMINSMIIVGETPSSASGGFFSSLIGGLQTPKYVETDEFILRKQEYVSALDEQLRQLSKSLDLILEKREELQASLDELIVIIGQMSDLEVNVEITSIMNNFEELQQSIKELLERSNISQMLTFGSVLDEYTRNIGSIRNCFENRSKVCSNVASLEVILEKKQRSIEKLKGKSSGDKIEAATNELERVQLLLNKQRHFQDRFNKNFKRDLSRFEFEKVREMKNMVEIYWEGLIENQKHLIELWELFYDKCNFD